MTKALLYTESEANHIKILPAINPEQVIHKETFDPDKFKVVPNTEYSDILQNWVTGDVMLIHNSKVASLWFEDGSVYDTCRGWRPGFSEDNNAEFACKLYLQLRENAGE